MRLHPETQGDCGTRFSGSGLLPSGALVLGAAIGWFVRVHQRRIAGVMAFGAGVLISALSFELMQEAYQRGGLDSTAAGFAGGATVYTMPTGPLRATAAATASARSTSNLRKPKPPAAEQPSPSGRCSTGIPQSMVIGSSLLQGGSVSLVTVITIFLSNIPEGLSSAAGMKKAGRSAAYVFGVWAAIAVASGIAAWAGYALFDGASQKWVAAVTAIAAGAILAMLAETMIPQAVEHTHGLITVAGFLAGA